MAEIILGLLCLVVGAAAAVFALIVAWAGALETSATGSTTASGLVWLLTAIGFAGIAGGIILIF